MQTNDPFRAIGPTPYLYPTPAVLVGCAGLHPDAEGSGRPNLTTVAWAGITCSHPPMLSIAVRPERHSRALLTETQEFTVNLVGEPLLRAMDFCGVKSGRDVDKFAVLGLHPLPAPELRYAPALAEAPAFLSCRVQQVIPLGSHDLFLAEILQVSVQDAYFRPDGSIDEAAMKLVGFVHGKYRALGPEIGFFGFAVAGDAALRRRLPAKLAHGEDPAGKKPARGENLAGKKPAHGENLAGKKTARGENPVGKKPARVNRKPR